MRAFCLHPAQLPQYALLKNSKTENIFYHKIIGPRTSLMSRWHIRGMTKSRRPHLFLFLEVPAGFSRAFWSTGDVEEVTRETASSGQARVGLPHCLWYRPARIAKVPSPRNRVEVRRRAREPNFEFLSSSTGNLWCYRRWSSTPGWIGVPVSVARAPCQPARVIRAVAAFFCVYVCMRFSAIASMCRHL